VNEKMDFNILKETKKPLLHRRDVSARIAYEAQTPSRKDIQKVASEKLKSKEELVLITKVIPENGSPSAHVEIRVYDNDKAMKEIEHNFTLVRHSLAEKKQKAPAKKK
jgi:ribosomal protein S24E